MKKNNRKKKINKNKLIIIVSIVVLLIIVVGGVAILAHKISKREKEKNKQEQISLSLDKQAINAFYNNFLIAYILQGDVETGSGTLTIEGDPNIYYAVTDPLFENIHTLADIKSLMNDSLIYYTAIRVDKLMNSQYANQYESKDDTLYVKKTTSICSVSPFDNIEKKKIDYINNDDKYYAVYENVPYQVEKDEYGNLKASAMWFGCSRAVNYTDIDKDSVYDPYKQYSVPQDEDTQNSGNNENGEY